MKFEEPLGTTRKWYWKLVLWFWIGFSLVFPHPLSFPSPSSLSDSLNYSHLFTLPLFITYMPSSSSIVIYFFLSLKVNRHSGRRTPTPNKSRVWPAQDTTTPLASRFAHRPESSAVIRSITEGWEARISSLVAVAVVQLLARLRLWNGEREGGDLHKRKKIIYNLNASDEHIKK